MFLQSKNEINIISSDDKVINIYNNNQSVAIDMKYIQVVIKFTMFETESNKEIVYISIPSLRSLLQIIEELLESKNQVRICHKTKRLFHENFFK